MSQSLIPVVPKISLYRDAVNVYVIQWDDGETGLFDLGSGAVLGAMQGAGMKAPSLVLHTDYRRDRVFGHHSHPGLPVAIGERDAPYLENAARIWQDLQVAHGYAGYERFLCPRLSVPAELRLTDGQLPRPWRKPYVYAQHLGAHTPGGMGYLIVDGDTRMLVSGDILQHDGTLHSIHELQRSYNFMEGLHALRRAVGWLASGDTDVLLPAHGDPVIGRENVMSAANAALERIDDFWSRWRLIWPDQPQGHVFDFDPITPHLRGASNRIQYAIVDDDGAAVFFDAGVSYPDGFETVLEDKGIRDVEWCIITHHHDDHLMGYDWLREKYGTRLATHECMVDVLERPQGYSLNCLHDRPYKVDMVMREGVPMMWRGFDIVPHFFPSQTDTTRCISAKWTSKWCCSQEMPFTGRRTTRPSGPPTRTGATGSTWTGAISWARNFCASTSPGCSRQPTSTRGQSHRQPAMVSRPMPPTSTTPCALSWAAGTHPWASTPS